jgi:N6-adenosine-specific RNA methylase IME4
MKIDRELLRRLPLELRIEVEENLQRKDFPPSELAAVWRAIETHERAAAKARQGERTDQHGGKLSTKFGKARDKVAAVAGVSGRTLEKIVAVCDAAKAEPEKFGKLKEDMDRTGRVNGVFRRLRVEQQAEIIRAEPPPLPGKGPHRCVVIDFPWADDTGRYDDPSHRLITPYPPMTLEEICTFDPASILTPDAVVWMWFTNYHVTRGIHCTVLERHGLQAKAMLTWGKPHFGGGDWLRGQTKQCILAVRGKPIVTLTNQSTLLLAPPRERSGHSLKPKEFYDLVESHCPAPRYADLFSRYRHNDKWDCHGDEAPLPSDLSIPPFLKREAAQ